MKPFIDDIEDRTEENQDYRHVAFTGKQMQLVLMALPPGEELGEEIHMDTDQFFRFEEGTGEVVIDGKTTKIEEDMAVLVPGGTRHNLRNTGHKALKFYTLYAPPQHAEGTIQHTKAEADKLEHTTG